MVSLLAVKSLQGVGPLAGVMSMASALHFPEDATKTDVHGIICVYCVMNQCVWGDVMGFLLLIN